MHIKDTHPGIYKSINRFTHTNTHVKIHTYV